MKRSKYLGLIAIISFIIFGFDASYAQNEIDSLKPFKYTLQGNKKYIEFENKSVELPTICTLGESPNYNNVAFLNLEDKSHSNAEVSIYNRKGELTGKYVVKFLSQIAVADDGRFVLFGVNQVLSKITSLYFYDSLGNYVNEEPEKFNDRIIANFNKTGNYFIVLASKETVTLKEQITVKLIIYDKLFNKIGEKLFDDWSRLSAFQIPDIDEKTNQIKLFRWAGEEDHLKKETVYLNLSGNLLEYEEGWAK